MGRLLILAGVAVPASFAGAWLSACSLQLAAATVLTLAVTLVASTTRQEVS